MDCERINFTYVRHSDPQLLLYAWYPGTYDDVFMLRQVRMTSQILQHRLKHELGLFCEALRAKEAASFNEPVTGVVSLSYIHRLQHACSTSAAHLQHTRS